MSRRHRRRTLAPLLASAGLVLALLPALAPAQQQKPIATRISLRHADAADVITLLKRAHRSGKATAPTGAEGPDDWMPGGVTAISPIEKGRALSVKGTPDGVRMLEGLVSLLDVPQKQVLVKMRVLRVSFGANGKKTETVLQQPRITTFHNKPAQIQIGDRSGRNNLLIRVTPRLPGGGQATLVTLLSVTWPRGTRDTLERPVSVPLGSTRRVIGVTDSEETPVMQAVGRGDLPEAWGKPCVAVYVEATPTEVPQKKTGGP